MSKQKMGKIMIGGAAAAAVVAGASLWSATGDPAQAHAATGRVAANPVSISTIAFETSTAQSGIAASQRRTAAAANLSPRDALEAAASGTVLVRDDRATGGTSMARADIGGDLYPAGKAFPPAEKVAAFLSAHGGVFGIDHSGEQLRMIATDVDQYGNTRVSYQQMHGDVPVFGAIMYGHVSVDGRLTAVNGKFIPQLDVPRTAAIDRATALDTATSAVQAQLPAALKNASLDVASADLVVFRKHLTRGTAGTNHLAYQVEVRHGASVREFVYVDALTGKVVDRISGIHGVKNRRAYEASYDPNSPEAPPPAWREGDPRPAANPAHEDEIAGAGQTYNLFINLSGGLYRSWDGNDAPMITVNNDPTIVCPNANWNGTSTNYCSGTSGDDVVAHEWGHAYTQETSGLIYQWQSGALNESYSDIWGETVDLLNNREGIEGTAAIGTNDARSQDEAVCSEFTSELPTGDSSIRWLVGEDAFAFSPLPPVGDAAIRDMWNPRCSGGAAFRGDPGHVTSTNYHCATSDAGGVHVNSAINNRAYAMLVDGNTLTLRDDGTPFANPVTVNPIGITKAAHIFWRANSVYNTPSTNFADNADSLEMACADLIGQNLTRLVTTAEDGTAMLGMNDDTIDPTPEFSGEVITAADCAEVANAIAAVEMRADVTEQCGFRPMLTSEPAPRCGGGEVREFFAEDWEGGFPTGWSTGQSPVSKSVLDTREWYVRSDALPANPDGSVHAGSVIYQENRRDLGNCSTDDESGSLYLESPVIAVDAMDASYLVFEHYVNTESLYDGGNVTISINGGPFEVIPASAFMHNPYPGSLSGAADQNTNPKAGEEAFHGSNPGETQGDWGESQIDLAAAGVSPGDEIRLRWDFGQDGCNGSDGWYVDRVELFTCSADVSPPTESCNTYPASGFQPVVGSPIVSLVGSVTQATVSDEAAVTNLNIRNLTGSHTYMGDLTFELESPQGTTVTLFDGSSCAGEDGIDIEFDDDAANVVGCGDWVSGGEFQPQQALATFNGEDPNGDWTLTITDGFPQDEGQLDSWEVELCTALPVTANGGQAAKGSGQVNTIEGAELSFNFDAKYKDDGELHGNLQLRDKEADVKIHMKDLTSLGPVDGSCGPADLNGGAIPADGDVYAMQFTGTGTFQQFGGNRQTATFRACAVDNDDLGDDGETEKSRNGESLDRFYLECVDGCTYNTGDRVADAVLDKGNIRIVPSESAPSPEAGGEPASGGDTSASTVFLEPALLSEGPVGALETFQVNVYDSDLQPLTGRTVSLNRVGANGTTETLNAITGPTGTALFTISLGSQETAFDASVDGVGSNAVTVAPIVP